MHTSKGNISLVFLAGVLFLTLFAQTILIHIRSDYQATHSYAQGLQLRQLCRSLAQWWISSAPDSSELEYQLQLQEGQREIALTGSRSSSEDGCFKYELITAADASQKQTLKRYYFSPTLTQQSLGEEYMFISRSTPTGAEYLSSGNLYTSSGSFSLPQINFLSGKASALNIASLHEYGFAGDMLYNSNAISLTYLSTAKNTLGDGLVTCNSNVTIKKSFNAAGRLIIISRGSVVIEDYVKLNKVLIMTSNNVTIGKGCVISGVIFAGGRISLNGSGTFKHDPTAVASYESAFLIA